MLKMIALHWVCPTSYFLKYAQAFSHEDFLLTFPHGVSFFIYSPGNQFYVYYSNKLKFPVFVYLFHTTNCHEGTGLYSTHHSPPSFCKVLPYYRHMDMYDFDEEQIGRM
jgi:hypothetical protein